MSQILKNLFVGDQRDTGYRIGFVAVLLIAISIIFPTFYSLGASNQAIQASLNMLMGGLVMTIFFAFVYRNKTRTRNEFAQVQLNPMSLQKQILVITTGLLGGFILVIVNGVTNIGVNIITSSSLEGFALGLIAGVAEELFFRGFIQTMLRIYVPFLILAVIPSALIFASFHFFRYQSVSAFIVLFILGVMLGLLYEITNDIGVPMLAHVFNNTFSMLAVVLAFLNENLFIILFLVFIVVFSYIFAVVRSVKK